MTNYIVEDNIDFYKLLNDFSKEINNKQTKTEETIKEETVKEETVKEKTIKEEKELCLIANEPLTKYYITLPCNHKFNYLPLLYACVENTQVKYNLKKKQIKCPYCKKINYNQVLPYNPLLETTKYYYVNYPQNCILGAKNTCAYIYKAGKNKGKTCDLQCYWNHCHRHIKYLDSNPMTKSANNIKKTTIDPTLINLKTIITDDLKKMPVIELRKLAKINNKKNYSKLKKSDLILLLKTE